MQDFVMPPALERGDRVAIVAPASNPAPDVPRVSDLGLERLRSVFDLEPVEYPTVSRSDESLYDHPEERAEDVMDAFEDPTSRACSPSSAATTRFGCWST